MNTLKNLRKQLPLTVALEKSTVVIIDQTKLPQKLKFLRLTNYSQAIFAIKNMQVRGAQAIGAVGAGGMFLAASKYRGQNVVLFKKYLHAISREIIRSRPTAINLAWAVNKILADLKFVNISAVKKEITRRYQKLLESEVNNNLLIGAYGNKLIKSGARVLTHCNAGSLSGIWFGTATAPIYAAFLSGKQIKVLADETRPWLQGARLTAWELDRAGLDYQINIDSASGYLMSHGLVDLVIVGADHIALNGDTANKIGTYPLALMAHEHHIPFYVAAVSGTIDPKIKNGQEIRIEERSGKEIISDIKYRGGAVSPKKAKTFNPVFDVTPAKYITGIITEKGIFKPQDLKKSL